MTENNCEEKCFWFKALLKNDLELAIFNIRAKQAVGESREFPGLANSLCGCCAMLKRNDPLKIREHSS